MENEIKELFSSLTREAKIQILAAMLTEEHFADASKMISTEEEKRAG